MLLRISCRACAAFCGHLTVFLISTLNPKAGPTLERTMLAQVIRRCRRILQVRAPLLDCQALKLGT